MRNEMGRKRCAIAIGAMAAGLLLTVVTTSVFLSCSANAMVVQPTASTLTGRYAGKIKYFANTSVIRYSGIPFAQPPIGDLRFQPPQPIQTQSPTTIIDATNFGKSCLSVTKKASSPYYDEDCLYLNVYTPSDASGQTNKYHVMVWIHGGGFVAGSVFPEPVSFVARGQVIVVTINYRLGVFGFLTTEDDNLPANNGLWDQVAALQWVKSNIEYFGGDSNSITIFGESAGAISASLLTLSPVASNLFNSAIFQSGTALSLLTRNPTERAEHCGRLVGCDITDSSEFASCLRNVSADSLLEHCKSTPMSSAQKQLDFTWMPNIDGNLIPADPFKLIYNNTYLSSIDAFDKNYLIGLNNNEGSLLLENFLSPITPSVVEDYSFFKNLSNYILSMRYNIPSDLLTNITDTALSFYTGLPFPTSVSMEAVIDFMADGIFYAPGIITASQLSTCYLNQSPMCDKDIKNASQEVELEECGNSTGKTYIYFFDFCPPSTDSCAQQCMTHGKDVSYEFPRRNFHHNVEQQVSDSFIDILTSFAKTADPGSAMNSTFPAFDSLSQNYINLSPYISVRQHLLQQRMNFWTRTIPHLVEEMETSEYPGQITNLDISVNVTNT